jgi:hypothetical protein
MSQKNYIENEKWSQQTACIVAWLEVNDTIYNSAIQNLLENGLEAPNDRQKIWESLRAIFNVVENSPIKRGRQADLDADVLANRDSQKPDFIIGVQAALNAPCFKALTMPRGGYSHYDEDNTLEDYLWEQASKMLTSAYRNFISDSPDSTKRMWDGTLNENGVAVVIPAIKEVTEGDEEE